MALKLGPDINILLIIFPQLLMVSFKYLLRYIEQIINYKFSTIRKKDINYCSFKIQETFLNMLKIEYYSLYSLNLHLKVIRRVVYLHCSMQLSF